MKQRAVIYTRVSTDEQKENGFSLQDQHAKLVTYCKKNELDIVKHYEEDHSAKDFNRPQFQHFLKAIKDKTIKADVLLCVRHDRFSRNLEHSLAMIGELRRMGVEFKTLENHTDLTSPESLLPYVINMLLPQVENERRGLNTKNGMRQGLREGRWMGKAPIGYKNDILTKTCVQDATTAPLIVEAFETVAKGVYSGEEVRRMLLKKGLKTCKNNFINILRNPFYLGKVYIPAWKDEPEQLVQGIHKAIIAEDTFKEVQSVLSGRRKNLSISTTRKEPLPLRGFLCCKRCGNKLTGSGSKSRNGEKHFYYHCQKGCKERFRADVANETFGKYLSTFTIPEEVLSLYYHILEDTFKLDDVKRDTERKVLESQIEKLKERKATLTEKLLDNIIADTDYKTANSTIEDSIADLVMKHATYEGGSTHYKRHIKYAFSLLGNLDRYYSESNLDVKQKIVGSIFPANLVFDEKNYRTTTPNEVLTLLTSNINGFGGYKKEQAIISDGLSTCAPRPGLEPGT